MPMPPSPDFGVRINGTRINRVMPGSNADRIGLKAGDVARAASTIAVPSRASDVADALEDEPPGSKIDAARRARQRAGGVEGVYQPEIVETPPQAAVRARRPPAAST